MLFASEFYGLLPVGSPPWMGFLDEVPEALKRIKVPKRAEGEIFPIATEARMKLLSLELQALSLLMA